MSDCHENAYGFIYCTRLRCYYGNSIIEIAKTKIPLNLSGVFVFKLYLFPEQLIDIFAMAYIVNADNMAFIIHLVNNSVSSDPY